MSGPHPDPLADMLSKPHEARRKAKEARCKGKKASRFRLPEIGNVEKEAAPVRKGPRIQSRPFDKTKSRGLDNQVRPRA